VVAYFTSATAASLAERDTDPEAGAGGPAEGLPLGTDDEVIVRSCTAEFSL